MSSKIRVTENTNPDENSFTYHPLQALRAFYSGFVKGIFYGAPEGYRWRPSLEETQIYISDENSIDPTVVGARPAITFTRGPVQTYNVGIGDLMEYDFRTGAKKKSMLIPGTMSINVCSRNDIEAENLAWVVAEQLWMNCERMMRAGFFDGGRNFVIGSPSPAGSLVSGDSGEEWYAVVVSSPFQLYRTSQRTPLGQTVLRNIEMVLQEEAQRRIGPDGPLGMVGANLPYEVVDTVPEKPPQLQPHPLDPTRMVVIRPYKPYRHPGVR